MSPTTKDGPRNIPPGKATLQPEKSAAVPLNADEESEELRIEAELAAGRTFGETGPALQHQVFISYASKDRVQATAVCDALEAQGIRCWIAHRDIRAGRSFAEAISKAIDECRVVVLIFSSRANASKWVINEIVSAHSQGKGIIGLRIEDVGPSPALDICLNTSQWLDGISKPIERHFQRLADETASLIREIDENPEQIGARPALQAPKKAGSRVFTARMISLAATVLVVVAALAWYLSGTHLPPVRSFAVMPLEDEAGSGGQEYWGVGFSGMLSEQLTKLPAIRVVPSEALFGYVDSSHHYATLGRTLRVDAVLTGKFSRRVEEIAVTVALVDVASDRVRWQKSYQSKAAHTAGLVSEISMDVAQVFNEKVPANAAAVSKGCAGSSASSEAFLKGMFYKRKGTAQDNALSIEYFHEALQPDSTCVPALVGLADAQEYQIEQGWTTDTRFLDRAEANCRRAIGIDSGSAGAYAVLGAVAELRGSDQAAQASYERALALDPASPLVLTRLALLFFNRLHDPARATKYLKQAQEFQPYNTDIVLNLGAMYAMQRQYREALESFQKVVELRPDQADAWHNLGYLYERLSKPDSAEQAYGRALALDNTRGDTYLTYSMLTFFRGHAVKAESLLVLGKSLLSDIRITYALGSLYLSSGRQGVAERMYKEGQAKQEAQISAGHATAETYSLLGLFQARLGASGEARASAAKAEKLAQPNDDVVMLDISRVYSILGDKGKLLAWFKRAHESRPLDYDEYLVRTTPDFEKYRSDPQLLAIAAE